MEGRRKGRRSRRRGEGDNGGGRASKREERNVETEGSGEGIGLERRVEEMERAEVIRKFGKERRKYENGKEEEDRGGMAIKEEGEIR